MEGENLHSIIIYFHYNVCCRFSKYKGLLRLSIENHMGKVGSQKFSNWTLGLLRLVHCFFRSPELQSGVLVEVEGELRLG